MNIQILFLVFIILLPFNCYAETSSTSSKEQTTKELLFDYIANNLKDQLINSSKMTKKEQKLYVENAISKLDNSDKKEKIIIAFKKEIINLINKRKKFANCLLKADKKSDAQICMKNIGIISPTGNVLYGDINNQNIPWTEQKKTSILHDNSRMIKISEDGLTCFKKVNTIYELLQCNPQKRRRSVYDTRVSFIVMEANTYKLLEIGDEFFNESCKSTKSEIFEYPLKNKGIFFDRKYYQYNSYHNIDDTGQYIPNAKLKKNERYHSQIDKIKLLNNVGFFETYKTFFDKKMKKAYKKHYYSDKKNSAMFTKKINSKYKVYTDRLKNEKKNAYGIIGYSMSITDIQSNKTIATSTYYKNIYKNKICGETYNGTLDAEHFVYKVFSHQKNTN